MKRAKGGEGGDVGGVESKSEKQGQKRGGRGGRVDAVGGDVLGSISGVLSVDEGSASDVEVMPLRARLAERMREEGGGRARAAVGGRGATGLGSVVGGGTVAGVSVGVADGHGRAEKRESEAHSTDEEGLSSTFSLPLAERVQ